jgi:hypothetical protein
MGSETGYTLRYSWVVFEEVLEVCISPTTSRISTPLILQGFQGRGIIISRYFPQKINKGFWKAEYSRMQLRTVA